MGGWHLLALQEGCEARVLRPGGAEVVEPRSEGGAAGATDGVGPGERDNVIERQPLVAEPIPEVGPGDVGDSLGFQRSSSVAPSGGHGVIDAAGQVSRVPGREGDDVGARDSARAVGFDGRALLVGQCVLIHNPGSKHKNK